MTNELNEERTLAQKLLLKTLCGSACALGALGFKGLCGLGHGLGAAMWRLLPARRELAVRNIREHLGVPEAEARDIARESFNHNACSFLEAALVPRCKVEAPFFSADEPAFTDQLTTGRRPMVLSTGHLGAWELLAALHGVVCPKDRIGAVVVRRYNDVVFNDLMVRLRSSRGVTVIGHRNAALPVLRVLRKCGSVAFLVDHHAGSDEALMLPFLGEPATVNMGPAVLALRGKAIIRPLCVLRTGSGYRVHVEPESLDTTTLEGDNYSRVLEAARFYTEASERMIRLAPEQWFWMHNRWKKVR